MQIGILEPQDFSEKAISKLEILGQVSYYTNGSIIDFIKNKSIIFVRLNYFLGQELLEKATDLKYICTPTTGLNHIDIEYIKEKGIEIISLKGEASFLSDIRATSEHTFGLILALLRNYKTAIATDKKSFDRDLYKGVEIYNNSIGIIGFGRIGKLLAKYINCFNGHCFFYDLDTSIEGVHNAVKMERLEELLEKCDVICMCASFETKNEGFFDSHYIDMLKDKFFINTARGELVNEEYLIQKIKENYFRGVAVDVIKDESLEDNNLDSFLSIKNDLNFIITPHIAGATYTSMKRTEEFITKKLYGELD